MSYLENHSSTTMWQANIQQLNWKL